MFFHQTIIAHRLYRVEIAQITSTTQQHKNKRNKGHKQNL